MADFRPVYLGERAKALIIPVTEDADTPLKYPYMFAAAAAADLILINKADLLRYVDFDVEQCTRHARSVDPDVRVQTVRDHRRGPDPLVRLARGAAVAPVVRERGPSRRPAPVRLRVSASRTARS